MLKRNVVLVLIAILILAIAVTGCSSNNDQPAQPNNDESSHEVPESSTDEPMVLNFNLGADPRTLDPDINDAIDGSHVINNTFEALTREIDGELVPAMAENWEVSDDLLTYTFKLRDAKWSDGQPVTAEDFAYAWTRVITPEVGAPYTHHMFYVKNAQAYYDGDASIEEVGIKAIDEKTFEVTLESPTPYFLSLITRPAFMPVRQDIVESAPETWAKDPDTAISNGPFILADYKTGDKLILKKNPNYWDADSVKLDQINYNMIVEASTTLTAYESGDLDIINHIPRQEIPRLIAEDPTFHILPQIGTYYLIFNTKEAPMDDVNVRKALGLAIDRKSITENVSKAGEIPATGFNPVGLKDSQGNDFNKTAGDYGINIDGGNAEEAKKLLAEAGYPNGEGFPEITLLYNTSESHKAIAEAIQEMFKQNLNINIKLANQEWAVFQDTKKQGNFQIARGGWIGDYPDPVGLLELFLPESSNNDSKWINEEFEDLINQSKYASGAERDEIIYQAEEIFMKDAPISPIYYYTDPIMAKENIKGWQKNSMSYWYFGRTSIE